MITGLSVNKACNVEDFTDDTLRQVIREVFAHDAARFRDFPAGREHRKHWEVAMAAHALRESGALRADAEVLGLGAGSEATLFWLTNHVGRVFATDQYVDSGIWKADAHPTMLTDPGRFWPGPWRPRRLIVQHMDARELQYEDGSFDAIFSSGSIEHFGTLEQIAQAAAEAFRVLKPGGVFALSTELLLEGDPFAFPETVMFTPGLLRDVLIGELGWEPTTELDLAVSPATLATEVDIADTMQDYALHLQDHGGVYCYHELEISRYPHIVVRAGGNVFTSVHLALRKAPLRSVRAPTLGVSDSRPEVRDLARHLGEPVVVVDAGCRWGFAPSWEDLGEHVRLIGFDPDAAECDRLRVQYADRPGVELVSRALGSRSGTLPLRRFRMHGADSFHPHDERALAHLAIPREGDVLEEVLEVEVVTLDDWLAHHGPGRIDVMKLDVQGHELEVLQGAESVLAQTRAIDVEVCFNPLMAGTPLFGAVDAWLRERGFFLWRIREPVHYPLAGGEGAPASIETQIHYPHDPICVPTPPGMLSWANAQYVRREMFDRDVHLAWDQRLRDAIIANALRFHDLSAWSLRRMLDGDVPEAVADEALRALRALEHAAHPRAASVDGGRAVARRRSHAPVWSGLRHVFGRAAQGARSRLRAALVARAWEDDAVQRSLAEIGQRLDQVEEAVIESNAYVARALGDLCDERVVSHGGA